MSAQEPAPSRRKKALVLGGGGILGAAFEIGVLAALEERYGQGITARAFDLYLGTSAGSFVAALVGQGVPPRRLYDAFVERDPHLVVHPDDVYRVDWRRLAHGSLGFARAVGGEILGSLVRLRLPPLLDLFARGLARLPAGFLSIEGLDRYLCRVFEQQGLLNSFQGLHKPILIPALDLDAGEHRVFGEHPAEDPTICQAVTASSAIPHLFGPVRIGTRHYVDGAVGGAAHLDVALRHGATSLLVINPVVPTCAPPAAGGRASECRVVSEGGLGAVLDQCAKLDHEAGVRLAVRATLAARPGVEIVLVQPRRDAMFANGLMEYGAYPGVLAKGFAAVAELVDSESSQLAALLAA